jgi:hypothetical protein
MSFDRRWKFLGVAGGALAALVACGGGDDASPVATQTVIGTITGFGSVIVNGVRFDDSAAQIMMDDAPGTHDRLRVGMVVQVRGRVHGDGTGVAHSIQYNDCVQGPLTAMNAAQGSLTVLGQTVQADSGTVFDGVTPRALGGLAIGDLVEVSCLRDRNDSQLHATHIERHGAFQNGVSELEVKGVVSNLNLSAGSCNIGGLTVNFAGIPAGDRPPGLANGMSVEAAGRHFVGVVLTADRLRDRDHDRIDHHDGDVLELEGYVSNFVSIANFEVNARSVDASRAVIHNGTTDDVANGARVEAEGTISGGVLIARVIAIVRHASEHR